MKHFTRWQAAALLLILFIFATAVAAPRTWKDKSGKFSIDAELIAVQQGHAVLRSADGRQLTVPIKSLSAEDQAFLGGGEPAKETRRGTGKGSEVIQVAENFFEELRSEKREVIGESLTTKAQEVLKGGKSPLSELPAPEEGKRAVRLGRPKLEDKVAEVPVQVRASGQMHKCKLHLRQEEDQWRIFAMSAMYPGGEKSINFEADAAAEGEGGADPLQALVGKPFQFAGVTLEGQPLDLSRYQGKVVLVDFWATWCGPCREEMPNIYANYQKHVNDGFEVIAVSVDEDLEALSKFVAKEKPPWAVVADNFPGNPRPMGNLYGIRAIPALILIGRDGKVAAVNCRGKQLGETLAQVLAGTPQAPGTNAPGSIIPRGNVPPGQTPNGQPAKVGNIPPGQFNPAR